MDYESSQLKYMADVHITDAMLYSDVWDVSLYDPLRTKLLKSLMGEGDKENFVYIGCGPLAPIIQEGTEVFDEISKFEKIVLIDISESYLSQAKGRLEEIFSLKEITCCVYDITHGMSEFFYRLMLSLSKGDSSGFVDRVGYLRDVFFQVINRFFYDSYPLPVSNSSFIYSELVATYTGIPALFDCEVQLARYEVDVKSLVEEVLPVWQMYNEKVYKHHILDLTKMIGETGRIMIATDIEKIYLENNFSPVSSFTKIDFPTDLVIEDFNIKYFDQDIMWDDSGSHKFDESAQMNISAHVHRIGAYTYERS
jgi:hypothetical protein